MMFLWRQWSTSGGWRRSVGKISNTFKEARLIQAEARLRIDELLALQKAFWHTKPGKFERTHDPELKKHFHWFKPLEPLPERSSVLASDAIEKLRHSLDHGFTASSELTYGEKSRKVFFPFGSSEIEFKRRCAEMGRFVSPEVLEVADIFMPFAGGNDLLYGLTLSNATKHRKLVDAALSCLPGSLFMQGMLGNGNIEMIIKATVPGPDEGLLLAISDEAADATISNGKIAMEILFAAGVEHFGGLPALDTLYDLAELVELIINEIEGATTSSV